MARPGVYERPRSLPYFAKCAEQPRSQPALYWPAGIVAFSPIRGPIAYWAVVAATTSEKQKINLSGTLAKELVFALLRARQRWVLRQDDPRSATTTIKSHFIAGLQRLLQRFEEKDKDLCKAVKVFLITRW
ncbi:hypothetical protein V8C34DRAFT_237481 [Trichoderma compactum]